MSPFRRLKFIYPIFGLAKHLGTIQSFPQLHPVLLRVLEHSDIQLQPELALHSRQREQTMTHSFEIFLTRGRFSSAASSLPLLGSIGLLFSDEVPQTSLVRVTTFSVSAPIWPSTSPTLASSVAFSV